MDAFTLDQFRIFIAVVEAGSFSAAARRLNRAKSAVTYAVQKLEDQVGTNLFDRSAYRPTLSEAGHILLPKAQRVLDDVARSAKLLGIEPGSFAILRPLDGHAP
ncbi:LysR family transcriptional regulator (plasmid) [Agrobacterium radiobacter]|nr:LysR family transcriptional regulator [Agrobacterium tumefaciens]MQB27834.1 LysR family transcriptional regulator [Agrobacterium tumefaciens]NTA08392.1 LysR family transcriptional regulator [Agrobacterium tumefaciens]NTB16214.1 LysR family transcriptional regulator [Agrobacterium tumefaciens]